MAWKVQQPGLLYAESARAPEAVEVPCTLAGVLFRSGCGLHDRNHNRKPELHRIPLFLSRAAECRRAANLQTAFAFTTAFQYWPRIVPGVQGPYRTRRTDRRTAILWRSMRN
jgi:hypothetical protein